MPGERAEEGESGSAGGVFAGGGEVAQHLATVDWTRTPLGDPRRWPQSLTSAVGTILRSRFSMWMAWGPELTFFCNDAYRRDTLGAKFPWALGRPAWEVWEEIWPDIGGRVERVVGAGEATWDEGLELFLERSGYREETYHTFSYSPLIDEGGTVAGMLCVVTEDTDRVIGARRMATLRDLGSEPSAVGTEDEVLRTAAGHLAGNTKDLPFALLYTLDADGMARLRGGTGLAPGHPGAPAVLDPQDASALWPAGRILLGREAAVVVDRISERLDGLGGDRSGLGAWDEPPTHAAVLPLPGQGRNRPTGLLVAGLNRYRPFDDAYGSFLELIAGQVSARLATARAYASERDRAEQLAELDRAKTAFFTNVSHEFRTPLTLLLGPAEDALADQQAPLPGAQRERVEIIQRNGLRLLKLVNTLLDFSRLSSGRVEARFEPVDLSRYTAELASSFASATERAGLLLTVDCPPLPEPVWVDQDLWAKVVFNLLSNALKFTFEGGIAVRLTQDGNEVVLCVSDTGIGIAAHEQAKLFERFYRASASRARTHEGSGIGLALVAEVAQLHGGSVSVGSAVGQGSDFEVRLPMGRAHLAEERVAAPDDATAAVTADQLAVEELAQGFLAEVRRWLDAGGAPAVPSPAGAVGGRPRVLVIDDNADMREYVARLLVDQYEVLTTPDGRSGVDLARADPPDLVLSDVMMPGLDGFGVLAALRSDPLTEQIPVILLSARAGEESTVEGLEAGADDYLVKPFSARELVARVGANLELDRARRTRTRLERSQALLDQAQRLAAVGSWELDLATGSVTASAELLRQMQMTDEEMRAGGLERFVSSRIHPEDLEVARVAMARVFQGAPLDVELRIVTPDGAVRTYRALGEMERDEEGRPVRLRGSNQDITDQREAERAVAAAAASREAAAREHRIADELQRSLVPAPTFSPDNLSIATFYRPGVRGTQVGGDWYDVIELGAGRTALVIGDVMGRGVRAAAVMGQLRAAVRAYARLDLQPADVLELLDGTVRDLGEDQIVTCLYAVYDPGEGTLSYANAGHLPPLLRLPDATAQRLTGAAGPPLGAGAGRAGGAAEQVHLPAGAVLALYTDGLVERRNRDLGAGIDQLAGLLAAAEGPLDDLPEQLVDALLPEGPGDDVAVLLAAVRQHDQPVLAASLEVVATEQAVAACRSFVATSLLDGGVSPVLVDEAVLVTSELVTNAVVHGKPPIELRIRLGAGELLVEVHDSAMYLPRRGRPTADDEHGRGLQIVGLLASRWGTRPTADGKAVWAALRRVPSEEAAAGQQPR